MNHLVASTMGSTLQQAEEATWQTGTSSSHDRGVAMRVVERRGRMYRDLEKKERYNVSAHSRSTRRILSCGAGFTGGSASCARVRRLNPLTASRQSAH